MIVVATQAPHAEETPMNANSLKWDITDELDVEPSLDAAKPARGIGFYAGLKTTAGPRRLLTARLRCAGERRRSHIQRHALRVPQT